MSLLVELPPHVEEIVRADSVITGKPAEALAAEAIAAWYGAADDMETLEAIRGGIADSKAGRFVSLDAFRAMRDSPGDAPSFIEAARARLQSGAPLSAYEPDAGK